MKIVGRERRIKRNIFYIKDKKWYNLMITIKLYLKIEKKNSIG